MQIRHDGGTLRVETSLRFHKFVERPQVASMRTADPLQQELRYFGLPVELRLGYSQITFRLKTHEKKIANATFSSTDSIKDTREITCSSKVSGEMPSFWVSMKKFHGFNTYFKREGKEGGIH